MTRSNSVSLTSSCGCNGCGWYDDWCCSNSCGGGCWNGGCMNGCSANGGCVNGCSTPSGCVNGCGSGCNGWWNGCWNGCQGACGSCDCQPSCSTLWPDAPALQSGGLLYSRIIGSGRLCQRVNDLTLCVQDIPEGATAPYALLSVSASGPVTWEFVSVSTWQALMRVTIPLAAQIRDCGGCVYTVHSSVTVDVPIRMTIPVSDLGRAHVAVIPGVRLLCASGCSEDGCFTVSLAVLVDVYLARWEPSSNGDLFPCRPDLPLTLPAGFGCSRGRGSCWR